MALPPTFYASLLAPKRGPSAHGHGQGRQTSRDTVLGSGLGIPLARSPRPRPSFCARLSQPSTPGGLALGLLLLAVGALVATGRLHARRKAAVPATGEQPGTCWLLVWLL